MLWQRHTRGLLAADEMDISPEDMQYEWQGNMSLHSGALQFQHFAPMAPVIHRTGGSQQFCARTEGLWTLWVIAIKISK